MNLSDFLLKQQVAVSLSEVRRLVAGSNVSINDKVATLDDINQPVEANSTVKVGRKTFNS